MVSLSGPTTANMTEGLNGAGNVSVGGTVANNEPGIYSWLPGGYTILSAPSFGTLTINHNAANGEGGYTWTFVFDSDDPALDGLDRGQSMDVTFNIRVTDVSYNTANGFATTVNGTTVVDTHQVTITIFGENEVCFARGSQILTEHGPCPVERLKIGDKLVTRDGGLKPIRWIASSKVTDARRRGNSQLEPVAIAPGTFAPGIPSRTLRLSPQHRVLLEGAYVDMLIAEPAVLASAKSLINGKNIYHCGDEIEDLEYWHIALDQHEVIYAEGCPVETFHPGDIALGLVDDAQGAELEELFPSITQHQTELAFPEIRAFEGRVFSSIIQDAAH